MMSFRVVIAGGGTGGHVFPALALAEALQRGGASETLFVGAKGGLEEQLVPGRGYRLELLRSAKLRGVGPRSRVAALGRLPLATLRAASLVRGFRPHVVVGVGGYASAPVVLAAAVLRVPVVLLEQNAIPGTVNRTLARLAHTVVTAFDQAERHLPPGRALRLGNPVRAEIVAELRRPRSAGQDAAPTLLVLGGSQGARAVNELMVAAAPRLARALPALQIHHQTGAADHAWVEAAYGAASVAARVEPFIDEMGVAYRAATLVVGRSGATTLAELCAAGTPALLIPYPHAADDHQAANAEELVQDGAAVMQRQSALDGESLAGMLSQLLRDPRRLEQMSRAMERRGRPEAAGAIAAMLRERFGEAA